MSERPQLAVVGAGIFGAEVALHAAEAGYAVSLFERGPRVLGGASLNNQNRLHQGLHYPRDIETGRQSIRGYQRFVERYPDCVDEGFPNAYFIADEGSRTSPGEFLDFCKRLGVPFEPLAAADFPVEVRGASTGVLCGEGVYDCALLRERVEARLRASEVVVRTGMAVAELRDRPNGIELRLDDGSVCDADAVVNCAYADINRLTAQLGHPVTEREYEYTVVPIVRIDMPRVGVTVMDGPFMTMLPYGKSRDFLLYDVVRTVVARSVDRQLDAAWRDPATAPFAGMDRQAFFEDMRAACSRFMPDLARAELAGFLEGPRMVLANNDRTDARPSLINSYGAHYHTVFAGKIDHCVWVAADMVTRLDIGLGRAAA
jgi:glycine/D-amino acid oxidase-like deaminating enzyme